MQAQSTKISILTQHFTQIDDGWLWYFKQITLKLQLLNHTYSTFNRMAHIEIEILLGFRFLNSIVVFNSTWTSTCFLNTKETPRKSRHYRALSVFPTTPTGASMC